ncbi:MAG: response regulator [Deltaproteobacteria bacterium]|nr:response regulator [Deltaproteobacteria bacterium]
MITRHPKNILIADDSAFFREKMSDMLLDAGHTVELAEDGDSVVERLENGQTGIDALLLDLRMPQMNGFKVLEWLRENDLAKLPTVCVSGIDDSRETARIIMALWGKRLIPKSAPDAQLISVLNNTIFGFPEKERAFAELPTQCMLGINQLRASILNISEEGAFLRGMPERLKDGTSLRLKFMLIGKKPVTIFPSAEVQWSTDTMSPKNRFSGHGIKFKYLTPGERNLIKDFTRNSSSTAA